MGDTCIRQERRFSRHIAVLDYAAARLLSTTKSLIVMPRDRVDAYAADSEPEETLPPEILPLVAKQLDPMSRHLLNFMFTCKTVHELAMPHFMSELNLCPDQVWRLQSCYAGQRAQAQHDRLRHVRKLNCESTKPESERKVAHEALVGLD